MKRVSLTVNLNTAAVTGEQEIELTQLKRIHRIVRVGLDEIGAFANVHDVDKRTVTIKAYRSGASAGDEFAVWLDSGTATGGTVTIVADGY